MMVLPVIQNLNKDNTCFVSVLAFSGWGSATTHQSLVLPSQSKINIKRQKCKNPEP